MSLVGTWEFSSDDGHFGDYMKELGVGFATRTIGARITPKYIISRNGNNWFIKMESTFKSTELKFNIDEEFDEETVDGRKCKSIVKQDGDKLVHEQRDAKDGKLATTITREIDFKDQFVQTLSTGSVVCVRKFTRSKDF